MRTVRFGPDSLVEMGEKKIEVEVGVFKEVVQGTQ